MKTPCIIPILACMFSLATALEAHMDQFLTLHGKTLRGLPDEYEPAEFDVEECRLRIGKNEMIFIPFLKNLFFEGDPDELVIYSSWYHETSILPKYIGFHVVPKGKDYTYMLLLNLDTLQMIKLQVRLKVAENSTRYLTVDVSRWIEEIDKSITEIE